MRRKSLQKKRKNKSRITRLLFFRHFFLPTFRLFGQVSSL